jgi:tetratricopeptide (TPR) repeat protein
VYRFRQGLYREVAYHGLAFRRRRELHGEIGRVLERRAGEDWASNSELLSLHFHEAQDWTRSWRYSVIAGDLARSKYAHREAATFYGRALSVPPSHRPAPAAVADVAELRSDELLLGGDFEGAEAALRQARRLRTDTKDLIRLFRKTGVVMERLGKYTQALRWYGRGLVATKTLGEPDASLAEGDLALAYSGVRFRQGRLHDALKWAHRAEAIARRLGDARILAHGAYLLTAGYAMLRRPEVSQYDQISLPLFEQLGDLVGQGNVLNNLGVNARDDSKWNEALDYYRRARAVREEVGDVIGADTANINIAELLSYQGHLEEAEALFLATIRSCRRTGYEIGHGVAASNLGRLAARLGDFDRARTLQADAIGRLERVGATYQVLEAKVMQVECETLARNGALALDMAEPLLAEIRAFDDPLLEPILLRIVAWAHLVAGDDEAAERVATECIEQCRNEGLLYEEALCLILIGQLQAARGGDRTAAHRRARELLVQLGVVQLPVLAETSMPPSELQTT